MRLVQNPRSNVARAMLGLFFLLLLGCTRSDVLLPTSVPPPTLSEADSLATDMASVVEVPTIPDPNDHAVVWIEEGEQLIIREEAGLGGSEVAGVRSTQGSITILGQGTTLGSSHWVEIQTSTGVKGWVPAWNLTESVPPEVFCKDPRVQLLVSELEEIIKAELADEFAGILSPKRGLVVRHDPWNPEVKISLDDVSGVFQDPEDYLWGTRYATETEIRGSFTEILSPALADVFDSDFRTSCNLIEVGQGAPAELWPQEYQALNLMSLHRPPLPEGNPFNWRTWVFAIEYVDGQPYLAVLMQIRPQA